MEQSLADLLTDAFAETSVPSFTDGDLDFESLNFDENISCENVPTKKEGALHQEATDETLLSRKESLDTYKGENVNEEPSDVKEDFQDAGVMSTDKMPEEDYYTSSDGESGEEGSDSGENEEDDEEGMGEKRGDVLMSVHCGDEFYDGNKEDRIFAERQPLAPEGTESPQVRNKDQGGSDEEVSYFERVPGHDGELMIKGDGIEEDKQEREEKKQGSDSDSEDMKIKQEHFLAQCFEQEVENPYRDEPAKAILEFPGISVENLQDLIAEVNTEENVERINDFSGEEHQQAGESFADYPSDFSSCEYVEDRGKNQENYQVNASLCASDLGSNEKQNTCLERAVTDVTWMGEAEDTDDGGDGYLYSRDLEMDADWDLDDSKADCTLFQDLVTTEDSDRAETLSSDVIQCPTEDVNSYLVIQREGTKTTSPSNQGSLDDSFFFDTELEASATTELGQLGDDEYEDDRNWEQEQERIEAFYRFYNDRDGENGREERQIQVQFCTEPLSQVIHYEIDR
ncbi:hypothetical protein PAMP_011931 [Pampus punctatissimus]